MYFMTDEKEDTDADNSVKILIRDLHDVLMMDVGNKIHNSGKYVFFFWSYVCFTCSD